MKKFILLTMIIGLFIVSCGCDNIKQSDKSSSDISSVLSDGARSSTGWNEDKVFVYTPEFWEKMENAPILPYMSTDFIEKSYHELLNDSKKIIKAVDIFHPDICDQTLNADDENFLDVVNLCADSSYLDAKIIDKDYQSYGNATNDKEFIKRVSALISSLELSELDEETIENNKIYYGPLIDITFLGDKNIDAGRLWIMESLSGDSYDFNCTYILGDKSYEIKNMEEVGKELLEVCALIRGIGE